MAFTKLHLYFDDVAVGQEWESLARTITEADVVNFAGVSGDFSPIHVDHVYARNTAFHGPIAHGLLVFSISSGLALHAPPMRTLAFSAIRDWQFKEPVRIGDTIRVRTRVLEVEAKARGRRGAVVWQRTVVNQDNQVVQEGTTMTLVQGRAGDTATEIV